MDQIYTNNQNDFLWTLLANPAADAHLYTYNLQRLVNDFPQSGILQAMLAHASDDKNLKQASAYFDPKSLYKLINSPSSFIGVSEEKIIYNNVIRVNGYPFANLEPPVFTAPEPVQHHEVADVPVENYFSENPVTVADPDYGNHLHITDNYVEQEPANGVHENTLHLAENTIDEPEPVIELPTIEPENILHLGDLTLGEPEQVAHLAEIEPINVIHHAAVEGVNAELTPNSVETAVSETPVPPAYITLNESLAAQITEVVPAIDAFQSHYITLNDSFASRFTETQQVTPVEHPVVAEPQIVAPVVSEVVPEPAIVHHEVVGVFSQHEPRTHTIEPAIVEPIAAEVQQPEVTMPVEHIPVEAVVPQASFAETEPVVEHAAIEPIAHEVKAVAADRIIEDSEPIQHVWHEEPEPEKHIEEEVYDEITGIDEIAVNPPQQVVPVIPEPQPVKMPEYAQGVTPPVINKTDDLIFDNIAATDYFAFRPFRNQSAPEPVKEQATATPPPVMPPPVEAAPAKEAVPPVADAENQDVSKYHDEKLPYSFLWWLDKTRKEHAATYQPYIKTETSVAVAKPKHNGDALQHQYYENIFHITSFEDFNKNGGPKPAPFIVKRKEQAIIERFIKEEPQIRPQSSDKLDNENKAKKSSEDRDEMVTETLAGIYTDQMLYHKAIASYKKLMLKFPEKSRYFASKIEQLEKKTN